MSVLALAAALWFAADPAASRVDVSGGVSIELRGGRTPVQQSDPNSEWGMLTILNPDVDMEVASRRGTLFNLGYTPRVQYRQLANNDDIARPLLLHQAYATLQQQLDPRWLLGVNLGGSVGEVNYNSVQLVLGDGQVDAPDVNVLKIAAGSAGIDVAGRLTRRHTLRLGTEVVYRTPLNTVSSSGDSAVSGGVPDQLNVEATVGVETRVSPVDAVEVDVTPGYFDYNNGGTQYATVDGLAQWRRQLRPSLSSSLGAGAFYFAGVGGTTSASIPVQPIAQAALTGGLVRSASHNVDATLGVGVEPYFNRSRVSLDSRASAFSTITIAIPPRWSVQVLAAALTNATERPRYRDDGTPLTETQVRLGIPVTYEISDQQQFEFGLLMSARAPHLRYQPFSFNQGTTWLYVAYRIGVGTARGGREVGAASRGAVTRSSRGENDATSGGRR